MGHQIITEHHAHSFITRGNSGCTYTRFDCAVLHLGVIVPPSHSPAGLCSQCNKCSAPRGAYVKMIQLIFLKKSTLAYQDGGCFNIMDYFRHGDIQPSHMLYID